MSCFKVIFYLFTNVIVLHCFLIGVTIKYFLSKIYRNIGKYLIRSFEQDTIILITFFVYGL